MLPEWACVQTSAVGDVKNMKAMSRNISISLRLAYLNRYILLLILLLLLLFRQIEVVG